MANSVNIPISLSLQSEDIVKEYKQAMQKLSNVSDLKNQFTEMLKLQAQYIANAEKIKDPLSKALNLQSAKEYSRLLNDIQNQVKKIDRDRLPEFEIPEIKFDNKQIINSFKGIDSEIQTIIDNIGTMNTMLGKSNVSEIFKGVGETQVTEYYKNIVELRKDIIKEEIKSGKVSSQSIENLLSVLQEAEIYQNRILQKNGKISDITKLLPKSIIDNEAFSKIMNRESLEVRWKEITMPGFVDNVRNAIMTKITQIATGEDFKLPTIGLEMDIDVANSFGEYQKKIDMATERLKKLVAKFYQTNEFRTDFQNLGISDDKSKTLNYYKLIFDIKSTMEEIETLSGAIGKSTKNIYGKKGLSGLVLNDYYSPDGDEYLGFNSIYKDLNSPENSKYLQIFKEKLISNISNGYKNVMTTVENETQDSLTKQLESINKILYTASDASYINNTSVEDEINSIIKSDDQAYTKLLNKRNEIISKLTDQGYEIESAVTDGIHGLVESNEIKKGKKVEFGRRKNDNKNNNINNVGSGSDSNATTNDKSVEEMDRRISDIEQEIQNIKQRIETIGGEDKSNNNRVVDALQTQINELKNTVKNISGGGASTKEIEDSLKKMQNDILEITEKIIGQETLGVLRQNLDAVTAQINGLATTNQITQLQSQLEKVNQIVTLLDDNLKSINSRLNQMALNTPNSQNTSVSNSTTNSESVNQEADAYEKLNQIYAKYNELQNTHYEEEQFELREKRLAQLKEYRIQLHELSKQIGEDDERVKDLTIKDGDKSLSLFSDEMTRNNIDERISELGRKQQDAINKKFDEFNKVKNRLNEIAPNGVVSESNLVAFEATVEYLKQLLETISNSDIFGDTTSFQSDIIKLQNKTQNMTLPKRKVQTSPQRKNKQNNSSAATEQKPTNNTQNNTTSEEDNAIVNRLNTRIAALETKLNTLDRAKRDTKSRLTALEQTTGATNASTKTLAKKSEVDAITNEINEIRKEINSLQTQMGNVVGRGVSSVDSNLDDSVNKDNEIFRQEADAITKSLGMLSKGLTDYDAVNHNIELPKINGDIAQIDTIIPKINELTKSLKNFKTAITGVADPSMMSNLDGLIGKLSISAAVQAASEVATAEVQAFKTIDDAVTGLTGHINTKTEAIRAEATEMTNAAKSEVESISLIKQAVSDLATQIHNVPKVRIVGENDGKLNISANLTEEQIAVIHEKLKAAFSGEQAIPISFVPNVESLKQQIVDALKDVPVEITNNNINKVIKVNKFKANSDGVEALRNSISSQLKNVKIQSFDATTAAESVKETLSKVLDGVGLKFDTEKLGNEVREAVNSGVEAASAEQKPETSDNKAVRFKEKATNDIGKLRDKYTDKLQGQQLEVFKERLNEIDNKIKEIKDDASNYTDENTQVIDKDIKQIESLVNSFKEINNSEDKINSLIQKLKDSKNNIEHRGAVAQPVVNNINSEMSALEELKRSGQNLNVGKPAEVQAFIDKLHEADATVESLQQSAKDIRVSTNATASVAKLDSKFNDLLFKVDKFRRDNSKITSDKGISAQFDSLMRSIQTIEKSDVNFQRLRAQFDQLKATVQGKGLTGRSLGDELKYIAEKIGIKAMLGNSIYRVIGAFRQMVGIVTELDTGMTTLRRVTEATEKQYAQFMKNATVSAHELGSAISDVVNATGEFSKLGYNLDEATKLGEAAATYANVGFMDISSSIESMTSVMQGFKLSADEAMSVVDKMDLIGNKFSISSAGIGAALQRSASSLVAAGNDLDEAISLVTAGNTVLQDPESVANGIKIISLRIRSAKSEISELGESTDDMVESSAKLQQKVQAIAGVNIMKDDNTFKSTYQILSEIANKWSELSDIDQANCSPYVQQCA